jgi:hypothetical protein
MILGFLYAPRIQPLCGPQGNLAHNCCGLCLRVRLWSADDPVSRSALSRWLMACECPNNGECGFGTGAVVTEVDLERTNVSKPPRPILSFWHDPSVASPQSGATINLTMKWTTPTHLEVTYDGHVELGFQVVRYANIEISVRDRSSNAMSTSR